MAIVVLAGTGIVWMLQASGRGDRAVQGAPVGVWLFDSASGDWTSIDDVSVAPDRLVLLIHGLDEVGGLWAEIAPALANAGHEVARFEYPNDQAIARSADMMALELAGLARLGTRKIDIVAHSMGGLVARDCLTRDIHYAGTMTGHRNLPDVGRLITVGTPHAGSPWAPLRSLMEVRERVVRFADDPTIDPTLLWWFGGDGSGEAGRDLDPGSAFLTDLNSRPWPEGLKVTAIAGRLLKEGDAAAAAPSWIGAIGVEGVLNAWHQAGGALGDGAVPLRSALPEGVDDNVVLIASHRGLVIGNAFDRTALGLDHSAALSVILDRLAESK